MKQNILKQLPPAYPWKENFFWFPSLDSTNDHLRALAKAGAPAGTVVLADHQTVGHGRRGRSFHSPAGSGIYLSLLLRPDCPPAELMHLTCAVAVAMCDAVEASAGFRPRIKWTNDLVWGQRKLGGILTEIGFNPKGNVDWAIIGVGINCCQQESDFPEEIRNMAGSLSMAVGSPVDRTRIAAAMLSSLHGMTAKLLSHRTELLAQYKADCMTLNRDVVLGRGDEKLYGHAMDIDNTGALVVRFADGSCEAVSSGEISVRGMYGYV
jgi:BirA family biotin operon repressor/biotin-[acetyl-CoA-carboxylase] ligase